MLLLVSGFSILVFGSWMHLSNMCLEYSTYVGTNSVYCNFYTPAFDQWTVIIPIVLVLGLLFLVFAGIIFDLAGDRHGPPWITGKIE